MSDQYAAGERQTAWTRRGWLSATMTGIAGTALGGAPARADAGGMARQQSPDEKVPPLRLAEFEPKSMLRVPATEVPRARFPAIDFHTHVSPRPRSKRPSVPPADLLPVMDAVNVQTMVNLTGGWGDDLATTIASFDRAFPRRFVSMTEPAWTRAGEPGYAAWQAEEIGRAKKAGAVGVKVLKTLGLYLRDGGPAGPLVKVDDPRFDPMWEACGSLGLPVAIHVGDPEAFFLTTDRFNERYEELSAHPDWSFHGKDFPAFREILEARDRVFARHPRRPSSGCTSGTGRRTWRRRRMLDRFPNVHVEIGARIGELGRQPRASARFFDRYQDRILFGTDAVPLGFETPQQVFGEELYRIYYRFLETEDEYFDYAPAPVPPQGRWRIYGLGLPEAVLRKVYHQNAERVLGTTLVGA
jgi:predicted TIM-barrel fold metal-dependent hydrolase